MVEFDDIIHLFSTLGFSGKKPPETIFQRAIQGKFGRGVQSISACAADHYFEQLKAWCKTTIAKFGEDEIRSRFYALFEQGILEFHQENRPPDEAFTKTAMILMVWNGEQYVDYREISDIIDDPFIIDGE
jgi:hypothetical protein